MLKVGSFSCDLSTIPAAPAELVQDIVTGFRPVIVDFLSNVNGTATTSWGFSDATQSRSIFNNHLQTADTEAISVAKSIYAVRGGGNSAFAHVEMLDTGFRVRWTKTGSPTDSFVVMYRAWDGNAEAAEPPGKCLTVNRSLRVARWGNGPFVTMNGANNYGNHVPATCMTAGPGTSPSGAGAVQGDVRLETPLLGELPPGCDWCRIHWDNVSSSMNVGWPAPHTDAQNVYWRIHTGATDIRRRGTVWQRLHIKHNQSASVEILTMIEDALGPITPGWTGATHFQYGAVVNAAPGVVTKIDIQHDLPPAEIVAQNHNYDTVSYGIGISKAKILAMTLPIDLYVWSEMVDKNDYGGDPSLEDDFSRSETHHRRIGGLMGVAVPNVAGQVGVVRFQLSIAPRMLGAAGIFFLDGLSTGATYYRTRAGVTVQLFNANPFPFDQTQMMPDGGSFLAANFDVLPGDIVQVANMPWQMDGA